MSGGVRVRHADALANAELLRGLILGSYERWEFAGSLRRGKPEVRDIEHCVISKWVVISGEAEQSEDLFRDTAASACEVFLPPSRSVNMVNARLDQLLTAGVIEKALYGEAGSTRWGEKYRGFVFKGHRHEVFQCEESNWGPTLAIRTGPAEFSQALVTHLKQQGRLRNVDGYVKYAEGPAAGSVRAVPTEREYFELCGVVFVPPEARR